MKKSNKILLAGLLVIVLLVTAMHITLYAKYKNGEYTVHTRQDLHAPEEMQLFPGISYVLVRNIPGASITFGDVAQVEKLEEDNDIKYSRVGDTLMITGKDVDNERYYADQLSLSLPYNAKIAVFNSFLTFKTSAKIADNNPVIHLQRSSAIFSGGDNPLQFGNVKVIASDSSAATFHGNIQAGNIEVQLTNSAFEFTGGNFGELSIVTDSVSRISLQSKHLSKAKITTIPN